MPKIVITHDVANLETWLKGKAERADAIGMMGGTNVVDHVMDDGGTTVAITFDIEDVEVLKSTLAAPPAEMAAAMERHGVVPPLTTFVEK